MIFKILSSADKAQVINLCESRKPYNFFIIANLSVLDKEQSLIAYYGLFNENDDLIAVAMFFHKLLYLEMKNKKDVHILMDYLINLNKPQIILNDSLDLCLEKYSSQSYHQNYKKNGYLYHYDQNKNIETNHRAYQATLSDINELTSFYEHASEDVKRGKESLVRSLSNGRRTFIYKDHKGIKASVLTTGELDDAAMIGGIHYLDQEALLDTLGSIVSALKEERKEVYVVLRDEEQFDFFKVFGFKRLNSWSMIGLSKK